MWRAFWSESATGHCPERNKVSITKELFQKLLDGFEQEGATSEQMEHLASTPNKIANVLRYIDGDVEFSAKTPEEVIPARRRTLIYLPEVVSSGGTGSDIVKSLKTDHYGVGYEAKAVMCGQNFISTSGERYHPVIVPGAYFEDGERISSFVDQVATRRMRLLVPPIELAHLLRRVLSMEEMERMGFKWVVVMHERVTLPSDEPCRLVISKSGGLPSLHAFIGGERREWRKETGFVYLAPKPQEK